MKHHFAHRERRRLALRSNSNNMRFAIGMQRYEAIRRLMRYGQGVIYPPLKSNPNSYYKRLRSYSGFKQYYRLERLIFGGTRRRSNGRTRIFMRVTACPYYCRPALRWNVQRELS